MNNDYKKSAILFVDDELQALKLFEKALSEDFCIFTAPSVAEAWKILDTEADSIGIVITDQRMPVQTGVELLERVRSHYPDIVRILTTAYSDLESAIDAVNTGGVYQYITKPWKLLELKAALVRAMEYYTVRKERDRLLSEKLHVLQRMLIMDRIRGLAALSAAIGYHFRNSMAALKSYVNQAPMTEGRKLTADDVSQMDLWTLARSEGENLVKAVREVLGETLQRDFPSEDKVNVENVVQCFIERIRPEKRKEGISFRLDAAPDLPAIKAKADMLERLIGILVERICDMDGEDRTIKINMSAIDGSEQSSGVRLQIIADAQEWRNGQVSSLYSAVIAKHTWPMGIDMDTLSAFFIAHHLGGSVKIHGTAPMGPGFEVLLDCNCKTTQEVGLDADWFDEVFGDIEQWDELPVS